MQSFRRFGWRLPLAMLAAAAAAAAATPACDNRTAGGPDEGIVLTVPFARDAPPFALVPMGETVYHPKPQNPEGHPGLDLWWNHPARILASAAGTVAYLEAGYWPGTWDVRVRSGEYLIGYTELGSFSPDLRVGREVAAGELIGHAGHVVHPSNEYWMIHWEFGRDIGGRYPDRLCPMSYFEPASAALLEQVWAGTDFAFKEEFPHICSGDYRGKDR